MARTCIVISTHNRAGLLPACVKAAAAQLPPTDGFSILIVNSASSDDTAKVIEVLRRKYPLVGSVFEPTPGVARARNRGLAETNAELVAFLEDDAVPAPDWLRSLVQVLDLGQAVAAGGRTFSIWPKMKRPAWLTDRTEFLFETPCLNGDKIRPIKYPEVPNPGNLLVDRREFLAAGGFSEKLGRTKGGLRVYEDVPPFRRLARQGRRVVFAPEAQIHHTVHIERLNLTSLARQKWAEGQSIAALGRRRPAAKLALDGLFRLPLFAGYNLLRRRLDIAVLELMLAIRFLAQLKSQLFGPALDTAEENSSK